MRCSLKLERPHFDIREDPPDLCHGAIETRAGGHRQIIEKLPHPGGKMPRKETRLSGGATAQHAGIELARGKTGHDFGEAGDVILWLESSGGALHPHQLKVVAQIGQGALVQKPRDVERGEGQQLTAPNPDEKLEELARDVCGISLCRGSGKHSIGLTKGRVVTRQTGQQVQHFPIGRCNEQ